MGNKYYGHTISELDDIKIESPTRTSVPEKSAAQPENTRDSTSNNSIPQPAAESKGGTENFKLDENENGAESSENAALSGEAANADADDVSAEPLIDESAAKPGAEAFEPGLDYNAPATAEYVRRPDKETRTKADSAARLLGKRLRFADASAWLPNLSARQFEYFQSFYRNPRDGEFAAL